MTKPKRERSPCVSCNVKHRCGKQDKKYCGTLQNHTIRREMRSAIRGFCESCEAHYVCDIKTCKFYKFTKGGR